jgi:tRNA pseudouridine38-40 synthase
VSSRTCLAVVQYAGAGFLGWQRQATGRTVQGEFEAVLARLVGRKTPVTGAGRTDTGVHALGQGVSFAVPDSWRADDLQRALNALLPADVWVERLAEMRPGFNARKHATARCYRYVIGTDEGGRSPFRRSFEWALGRPLELEALCAAARVFVGEHDFRALSAAGPKQDRRCRVTRADWTRRADGTGVTFVIEADRFLHRMVRFLVGTMVDVALGRRPVDDCAALLAAADNQAASPPAPPQGLYLVAVRYPDHLYAEP